MEIETFRYSRQVGCFLKRLFCRLEEEKICFCVLHSYEGLPDHAPSDVDMAVDPEGIKKIEPIVVDIAKKLNFNIVQKLYYDIPRGYFYVIFFRDERNRPGFIQLDFLNDDYGIGRYCISTTRLLQARKKFRDFYIPSAGARACYLLSKKAIKEQLTRQNFKALKSAFADDPADCRKSLRTFFGRRNAAKIAELIHTDNFKYLTEILPQLKRYIKLRHMIMKPQYLGHRLFWLGKRVFERMTRPTGIIVVLVGPDGAGKSSVADKIATRLRQGFRKTNKVHWRPNLLPPLKQLFCKTSHTEMISKTPHRWPADSRIKSLFRFLYYAADFVIGYFPVLLWPKIRTSLVIVERYYYDFLIDKKRYRLQLPFDLEKKILPLIPKPDIVLTFSGPADLIYSRKQEIEKGEIDRQLKAQSSLSSFFGNIYEIKVDQPFQAELAEVEDIIVSNMQTRLVRRLGVS